MNGIVIGDHRRVVVAGKARIDIGLDRLHFELERIVTRVVCRRGVGQELQRSLNVGGVTRQAQSAAGQPCNRGRHWTTESQRRMRGNIRNFDVAELLRSIGVEKLNVDWNRTDVVFGKFRRTGDDGVIRHRCNGYRHRICEDLPAARVHDRIAEFGNSRKIQRRNENERAIRLQRHRALSGIDVCLDIAQRRDVLHPLKNVACKPRILDGLERQRPDNQRRVGLDAIVVQGETRVEIRAAGASTVVVEIAKQPEMIKSATDRPVFGQRWQQRRSPRQFIAITRRLVTQAGQMRQAGADLRNRNLARRAHFAMVQVPPHQTVDFIGVVSPIRAIKAGVGRQRAIDEPRWVERNKATVLRKFRLIFIGAFIGDCILVCLTTPLACDYPTLLHLSNIEASPIISICSCFCYVLPLPWALPRTLHAFAAKPRTAGAFGPNSFPRRHLAACRPTVRRCTLLSIARSGQVESNVIHDRTCRKFRALRHACVLLISRRQQPILIISHGDFSLAAVFICPSKTTKKL